ncbi:MAG: shikimate kinase [Hymenobacteraceae bacterium]|nr:shikimate kinase [Hymenobacteraceae bacterium]MDX5483013.1 shikimate kinase [Hymenobacteraceae bacterium]
MLIFLIGMMGSGKTTLGKQLAERLGYPFVDLDVYIEQQAGKTIAELFEQEGQEAFRRRERKALEAVAQEYERGVVSTGGGAPCFFNNMDFINGQGVSIFLDVPVEELAGRLRASDLQMRPLLAGKTEAALKAFLVETLEHRRQFYERAKHTVKGAVIDIEHLLCLI